MECTGTPVPKAAWKSTGGSVADSLGAFPFGGLDEGATRVVKKIVRSQAPTRLDDEADVHRRGTMSDQPAVPFKPDGRACKVCGGRDCDVDPVDSQHLAWYYAPKDGVSQGFYCFYCAKVWYVYFRHFEATRTLTLLIGVLGREEDRVVRNGGLRDGGFVFL